MEETLRPSVVSLCGLHMLITHDIMKLLLVLNDIIYFINIKRKLSSVQYKVSKQLRYNYTGWSGPMLASYGIKPILT